MDEEYTNKVPCKEDTPKTNNDSFNTETATESVNKNAEDTLDSVASLILVLGIIGTVFCLFTLTTTKVVDPDYHYSTQYITIFNPVGIAISIGVLFSTITTWAVLKILVFCKYIKNTKID